MKNWPDEKLMKLFIRHQNTLAFSVVYQRHFSSLSKYLGWLIHDIEKGKDITQNIFLKIYQNPALFDTSKNFKIWLFIIAKNQWKNELRNQAIRNTHKKILGQERAVYPSDSNDNKDKLALLKTALEKLTESHREVFILKYSNNLSIKEISEICNCSEGTIKSRLFYALKKLKAQVNLATIQKL